MTTTHLWIGLLTLCAFFALLTVVVVIAALITNYAEARHDRQWAAEAPESPADRAERVAAFEAPLLIDPTPLFTATAVAQARRELENDDALWAWLERES